jgi:hypothetical protein
LEAISTDANADPGWRAWIAAAEVDMVEPRHTAVK